MSQASETFAESIQDADNLLRYFNKLNSRPPPPENEVLKRAGLIMAITAWETYVEDRLREASKHRLGKLRNRDIADFVESKLDPESFAYWRRASRLAEEISQMPFSVRQAMPLR